MNFLQRPLIDNSLISALRKWRIATCVLRGLMSINQLIPSEAVECKQTLLRKFDLRVGMSGIFRLAFFERFRSSTRPEAQE